MSLDLGGTNFRVIVMELTPDKEFLMDNKIYAIPQDVMTGMIIVKNAKISARFLSACLSERTLIERTHIERTLSERTLTLLIIFNLNIFQALEKLYLIILPAV